MKENIEWGGDRKSRSTDSTLKLEDVDITKNESSKAQLISGHQKR